MLQLRVDWLMFHNYHANRRTDANRQTHKKRTLIVAFENLFLL